MKQCLQISTVLSFVFLSFVFFPSCKPEQLQVSLSISPSDISVSAEETSAQFSVSCNSDWTVTCSDSWISSYTRNGTANGAVNISFNANTDTSAERKADFVIVSGDQSMKFKLTQGRAAERLFLTVDPVELTAEATATTASFAVVSNTNWKVSTNADWITDYTKSGNDNSTISIFFDQNDNSSNDREAVFTLSADKVESVQFKIVQSKCAPKEQATDVTLAQFNDAPPSATVKYRISGFVDVIVSPFYGSLRLADATGKAFTYCLKDKIDGVEGDFEKLGVEIGDYISAVGYRGDFTGAVELVDGYMETHKRVTKSTLAEYLKKPDGSASWYKLTGTVKSISDSRAGDLVLTDGTTDLKVVGVLTGLNGQSDKFSSLNVKLGNILTVIAPKKSGETAVGAFYVTHKSMGLNPGVLAQWDFSVNAMSKYNIDQTWTGAKADVTGKTDATEPDTRPGSNGRLIYAVTSDEQVDNSAFMEFYQIDKSGNVNAGKAARIMYYSGQPGISGVAVGDYFLFTVKPGVTIPQGTKIKFSFVLRPGAKSIRYWLLKYCDGPDWTDFSTPSVQNVNIEGKDYSYSLSRETSDESIASALFVVPADTDELKIKIIAAAPVSPDGTIFPSLMSTDGMRFRGTDTKKGTISPLIEIL